MTPDFHRLRVATYNIRKAIGLDRRRDPGRILDVINALDADVVALQEADRRLGARPTALPREMISHHSDFEVVPLAPNGVSLGWHGNAILRRKSVPVTGPARISLPGLEPRGAVQVTLDLEDAPVMLIATHLGLTRRHRQQQLHVLRERAKAPNAIILGDFNEWSPSRGLEPLAGFNVHAPGTSYHAARPVAALDRIATTKALELKDAGVAETRLSRRASDHLPVWADVTVPALFREEDRQFGVAQQLV